MAIYRHSTNFPLSKITPEQRMANQAIITGTDQVLLAPGAVVLLELLKLATGDTVTIKDGNGDTIGTGITSFEQDYVPMVCVGGITITGSVEVAKVSVIQAAYTV